MEINPYHRTVEIETKRLWLDGYWLDITMEEKDSVSKLIANPERIEPTFISKKVSTARLDARPHESLKANSAKISCYKILSKRNKLQDREGEHSWVMHIGKM